MLSVSELKKRRLFINRVFDVSIDNVITNDSEDFDYREEVEINVKPRLDIIVNKGEADFAACFSVEYETFGFKVGTVKNSRDWESCSNCECVKFSYIEKGKEPVVYSGFEAYEIEEDYSQFFSDILWLYGSEYKEGGYFKYAGGEDYSDMIRSALIQAILNEKDKEKNRVLSAVMMNND